MVYNRFRIQLISRVVLFGAALFIFMYLLVQTSLVMTTIMAGLIAVLVLVSIVRTVEKTNRSLTGFFQSIRHSDFTQTYKKTGIGSSFDELHAEFNSIMAEFHSEREKREVSRRYLESVVQHVGIGLISFHSDGTVEFINTSAKKLLGVPFLNTIQSLSSFSPELVETLLNLRSGQRKLVKVADREEILHLAVYATEFVVVKKQSKLVSIHNIQDELEEQEMRAWQNLIRVLTHEIMNSITPIASLASTVDGLLQENINHEKSVDIHIQSESANDIRCAVETIRKRSEGLIHFVDNYRNLTRVPTPKFIVFPVYVLFERVQTLLQARFADSIIEFSTAVDPENLELTADLELIEQVLINLLLNAIEATGSRPGARFALKGEINDMDRVIIKVIDNGPGIVDDVVEKIFIPFFTTKPKGSGIGLSLSRQIMRVHGGSLTVRSKPNVETVFTLRF
ncbi:PAS domain-containing sensor histidine kinase [Candidatus Latescibacterota bacterium]